MSDERQATRGGAPRTPAAQIRSSLIAAGRRILEENGQAGLTVRAVASAAGVAPMGVYNHFDGKEGLLNAVVTDGFREFAATIAASDDDPARRLAACGRGYRRFALANPTLYALMFAKDCQPDAQIAHESFLVLAEVIRYGQLGGVIRDGDPHGIALEVWSCVHGAMSLELSGGLPEMLDAETNYEGVIALVARGLAPATRVG
ncbi:TetR/AcrR family transcriptional regulator [Gordonia sp. TBRC 11910]|uniref:TetR/AcrR family transcriptional regulator n=1 Tax=Gordonia asplenii TaxID=2725283 RepID=A0A848KV58_9ACTN|nr:TetR/AcrR family transcriptional regulator [Gordonia asplenii]NMO02546.1 TetR/AcrR family transcriptional regulator [Gordonia asplenii]